MDNRYAAGAVWAQRKECTVCNHFTKDSERKIILRKKQLENNNEKYIEDCLQRHCLI